MSNAFSEPDCASSNGSTIGDNDSPLCPAHLTVKIGIGEKVIIASDLFVDFVDGPRHFDEDLPTVERFVSALNAWDGPGVIVVAGNLLDLVTPVPSGVAPSSSSPFFDALGSLTERANVKIYLLPGFRDGKLAYDSVYVEMLRDRFDFQLALGVELQIETIDAEKRILVWSGREFDSMAKASDPYSPVETPWAYHLLKDFWPQHRRDSAKDWLAGVERLTNSSSSSRFLISRVVYRRLAKFLPWLLIPLLISFLIRVPFVLSLPVLKGLKERAVSLGPRLAFIGATSALEAAFLVAVIVIMLRWSYSRFLIGQGTVLESADVNLPARLGAAEKIDEGFLGLVVGHLLSPELSKVGQGFFACTGSISRVFEETPARLGLPSLFRPKEQVTWIEIEAGAEVHVRLMNRSRYLKSSSLAERIALSRKTPKVASAGHLASFPDGNDFRPIPLFPVVQKTPRRVASAAIFLVGALNLASALTPPIRARIHVVSEFVPLGISRVADAIVAMASIGLMFLAGGIRRGQRPAWTLVLALSIGAATLNIVKGGDFEEAALLLALSAYLALNRKSFTAPMDRPSLAKGARTLAVGGAAIIVFATTIIFGYLSLVQHTQDNTYIGTMLAVSERMAGIANKPLPGNINKFATPALAFAGVSLVAIAFFLIFRPLVDRTRGLADRFGTRSDRERARSIVMHHSRGTLDYFALRDDKRYFFAHGCVISYANYGTVALVSPDPVGPATTQQQAWKEFVVFAHAKGWTCAVLGADELWLETYASTGMRSLYVGDEAIVTVQSFHLEGKKNKSLRQAVSRIKKYGYTAEFCDPISLDPDERQAIFAITKQSRQGEAERGFSMTLGRALDPVDHGLLLTICKDTTGKPVGFCQWVPAPGINGYSLDLMRRDLGSHPNGITDFMIVSTIEHLREQGYEQLSLNFATMRAVLAGEMDSLTQRVEKWFLKRMSESMQIESLWRFNSKFDPVWRPRYVVYDNIEHAPAIAFAVARAEAFWELPLIGRFLTTSETTNSEGSPKD